MKTRIIALVAAMALMVAFAAPVGATTSNPICAATQNVVSVLQAKAPSTQQLWLHWLGLPTNFLSLSSHQQSIVLYHYSGCP